MKKSNPEHIKAASDLVIMTLGAQVERKKLTDPEAMAAVATVLGLLLATTPKTRRAEAHRTATEIINQILEAPAPEAA